MERSLSGPSTHGAGCVCQRCLGMQPGNTAAVIHGAYIQDSTLASSPRVRELITWIEETQPVRHLADRGAVYRLALVYERLERSTAALDKVDEVFAAAPLAAFEGKVQWLERLRDDHARWIREAGRIEADLARTPVARGKLGLHLALGRRALSIVELHEAAAADRDAA